MIMQLIITDLNALTNALSVHVGTLQDRQYKADQADMLENEISAVKAMLNECLLIDQQGLKQ